MKSLEAGSRVRVFAGGGGTSDTTIINSAAMIVIGTTGINPNHASAPGVEAVKTTAPSTDDGPGLGHSGGSP